jgi:hypothetical protein
MMSRRPVTLSNSASIVAKHCMTKFSERTSFTLPRPSTSAVHRLAEWFRSRRWRKFGPRLTITLKKTAECVHPPQRGVMIPNILRYYTVLRFRRMSALDRDRRPSSGPSGAFLSDASASAALDVVAASNVHCILSTSLLAGLCAARRAHLSRCSATRSIEHAMLPMTTRGTLDSLNLCCRAHRELHALKHAASPSRKSQ